MTPEGWVKNEVKKVLKELGLFYFMPVAGGYGRAGVSDIVSCVVGRFVVIETKATAKDFLTALQQKFVHDVEKAGGVAWVVHRDNILQLRGWLLALMKEQEEMNA